MKKVLFIIGILILLSGIMIARPDDTRDMMERAGSYQSSLEEPYNSTYNRTHDALGDNTDIAGYGVAMVGLILMALSFVKKKKEEGGLLYQSPEHQQISPERLEQRANNAPPINSASDDQKEFEIPEPERAVPSPFSSMTAPTVLTPAKQNPIQDLAGANGIAPTLPSAPVPPPVFQQTAPAPAYQPRVQPPAEQEQTFKCSECGEVFTIRGDVKEVICPKCGTRYNLEGL